MQAVILAGGKGTRLKHLTKDIPKPLIEIADKPILEHQIDNLKANNIKDLIIIVGHLGDQIQDYLGDGSKLGVNIDYIVEEEALGTAGGLYFLKDKVDGDFCLIYGDIMFDVDFDRFIKFHQEKNSKATMFVHPNSHPYDSDLLVTNDEKQVIDIDLKSNARDYYYANNVNSGLYVLNVAMLDYIDTPRKLDFEKDILAAMIEKQDQVYAYKSTEYVKDMGTLYRLDEVTQAYNDGIIKARNLQRKQKCIFLDRDGTINVHKGLLADINEFELEAGALEAIKLINQSDYITIVITNQPVIARNLASYDEVLEIHKKMETLLGEGGAYVDDIFFCPHHPDKGYPEENPLYKIKCDCRKPGLKHIQESVDKYNIDLASSYMIGDTTIDVQTGINAGMKTILLGTGEAGRDAKYEVEADYRADNLLSAVELILAGR